jgi:hypothetical protein
MTDKAIDKLHQLIRARALYRRNLTSRTATARSHNSLKPYSNKLPVGGGEEQAKALPVKPWLTDGRRGATRAASYRGRA